MTAPTLPATLPALSLRKLRDLIREGDPGCLCDPELFTGPAGIEPEAHRAARIEVARQVCASCPVRLSCLAYALRTRPAAGVWAGFTAEEITGLSTAARRRPDTGPAPRANRAARKARRGRDWRGGA
jgi:WhiB family transcriptional regulator, redox-sensing transcriptional regulator